MSTPENKKKNKKQKKQSSSKDTRAAARKKENETKRNKTKQKKRNKTKRKQKQEHALDMLLVLDLHQQYYHLYFVQPYVASMRSRVLLIDVELFF